MLNVVSIFNANNLLILPVAFHFNSGRVGKFIECEFEVPLPICRSKIVSEERASVTFVIQASKHRRSWQTMVAFRQSTGVSEVVWKTRKAYKFWRYVLVDHSGKEAWFSGIGWFIKTKDFLKLSIQTEQ